MGAAGVTGWVVMTNILEAPPAPVAQQSSVSVAQAAPAVQSVPAGQTAAGQTSVGPQAAAAPQQIQRVGQVTAASPTSLTTTTAAGVSTTFRITPSTTHIGQPTALQQNVVVMGVIRDGVPVATAIADRQMVGPDGPPMDYQLPV
ncbi:cytoskeletal protein RodZ [Mycolicibacterium iranicum]|uniref:Cytoskeletal protein RodZ n=1 Tax=Mycolicibacterium iranicum TaxID=912594 RepID=A0A839Q1A7_MYCIR|nr:hypothetical protein [Mycolicibacterium iranicum]MBB2989213.1 cytoskeletal protein RodZ [Mycolicibacterium iranicum]